MFEGGKKAYVLSTDASVRPTKVPTGVYELLLCLDCETQLSVWENYARRVIYGGEPLFIPEYTPVGLHFRGLDYKKFKLFQLSMLWKANVTQRSEFRYCNMSRGRRERLRKMLLEGDPGTPREFGCILLSSRNLSTQLKDFVQMPEFMRIKKAIYQRFVAGGMFWMYCIPNAHPMALKTRVVINRRGQLHIIMNEQHSNEYVARLAHELHERGNLRAAKD